MPEQTHPPDRDALASRLANTLQQLVLDDPWSAQKLTDALLSKPPTQPRPGSKAIARADWQKRLIRVRALALQRLARCGLDVDAEPMLIDEVHTTIGALLAPLLPHMMAEWDDAVRRVPIGIFGDVGAAANALLIESSEAAFLYGVIVGTVTPWNLVLECEPGLAPRAQKGGAK